MKRNTKILFLCLTILVFVAAIVAATSIRRSSIVGGLTVNIDYQGTSQLISTNQIESKIAESFPGITSSRVRDINLKAIESLLATNPSIEKIHSAISVGGRIVINIVQRRPIAKVHYDDNTFYIDKLGHCFPLSNISDCDVLVANGIFHQHLNGDISKCDISLMAIDSTRSQYGLVKVWAMSKYLDSHFNEYGILFDQLFLDSNGDIILQPRLYSHEVVIGSLDYLDEKFANLKLFYAKGLPHAGYDSYSRVSLKYRNQVVCTKKTKKQ